ATVDVSRRDRLAAQARVVIEEIADDVDPLLTLERAGAIDENAARLCELARLRHEPTLQGRERRDIGRALEPGDVGMAADGSRRRAGGIEEDGVERAWPPLHDVGRDRFGRELEASEVLPQPFESPWRAVDGDDAGAGGRELGGLATRRRAQIRDAAPAHVAEELRRQRRGGVLHPPGALGIARELRYRSVH